MAQSSDTDKPEKPNANEDEEAEEGDSFDSQSPSNPTDPSSSSPLSPSARQNPNPATSAAAPNLLHLAFNQDSSCFSAATTHGFRIYNTDPFRELFRRDFVGDASSSSAAYDGRGGGIGAVAMLFRFHILALVGGGPAPEYPKNKVMLWDDHQSRCIGELSFRSEVKAVRLRRDRIIVVLLQKIFVYNFADLELVQQIETWANPRGLCEVSHVSGSLVLVCLGLQKGQVRVEDYGSKRTRFIAAHDSRIASIALTQDGRLLATASVKGTLIRVFNALDGSLLQEVRRGAQRAGIYSLAFSSTMQWLAVSSDKGTVHVFSLNVESGSRVIDRSRSISEPNLPASSFSFVRGVLLKYLGSEWSMAQFRLREGIQFSVTFGHQKNTVLILGTDGSFHRCKFDPMVGGDMTQLEHHNFLKSEETL